jgi:lipopolysaccharide transport system ATP-binding protein
MSDIAIRIEHISKQYRLGGAERVDRTLRETVMDTLTAPFRRLRDDRPTFWALRDVSTEIKYGEVVGLIGRNGAGKSTLLKVLSRITEPSAGKITLYGRIGSLLEVGTGFHPELTGRENVYMNGAILGMKREEITRKFDEIVAFAEIEKFIDTPVKHYSSGMYLRLAFSVAAHLETEILLVDEVLAVGDLSFQRKCLNKMQDVGQQGRTVVLVSHNMAAIKRLCSRVLLLSGGQLQADDDPNQAIDLYINPDQVRTAHRAWDDAQTAPKAQGARLCAVSVCNELGEITEEHDIRRPIHIAIEYEVTAPHHTWACYLLCNNEEGTVMFLTGEFSEQQLTAQNTTYIGRRVSTCIIPPNLMAEGKFTLDIGLYAMHEANANNVTEYNVLAFTVFDPIEGDSARGMFTGLFPGVMRPLLTWQRQELAETTLGVTR